MADEIAREFVVIARNIDHFDAFAHAAQQLLHDVIMRLRPVPAALQSPAVDDVADEVDRVGLVEFEKIKEKVSLTSFGAEMDVGQKQRAVMGGF